jgi:pyruvate/2-oxoglutarate/acetoin dehydrogenase E1 component
MSLAEHKKHKIALKDQHLNQLAKLTFKSEADIEFYEIVRDYMKARAEIEQQHSKVINI